MSQDEIHQVANQDTPRGVEIPNTMNGIMLWLLGRFGVAVVFAASTWFVYQDMRADRAELIHVHMETIGAIRDFRAAIESQSREISEMRNDNRQ